MNPRNERSEIETYPVGLFSDYRQGRTVDGIRNYLLPQARRGNWRAVRNYFNGYLAEWHYPPEGMRHSRCGKGWTRAAARRSLMRHILEENLAQSEVGA